MKILLAHDWFTQYGGAERMFLGVAEAFPNAPVYTIAYDASLKKNYFSSLVLRTSFLQYVYRWFPRLQYLLPLMPVAVGSLRLAQADIVLSSSSSFIKGLRKPTGSIHINYCHTPTRFVWSESEYVNQEAPPLLRPPARYYLRWFKRWDYNAAQRVDFFIANSKEVQRRIKEYYHRDSVVLYPFVDTKFWMPVKSKQNYFLLAGRLHTHKNNEMVIRLFNRLRLPLHVVGTGRQEKYLKSIGKENIVFLGRVTDEKLREEYSGARAYLFPQYEDFGLMPLEAASCGTATIGLHKGGTLETVVPGKTGELYDGTEVSLEKIVTGWDVSKYKAQNLISHAQKFNKERFKRELETFVRGVYENRS